MNKSTTIWKAGLAGLITLGSAGCQQSHSLCGYAERPPTIIVRAEKDSLIQRQFNPEVREDKWKQEGDYWYRTEVNFGDKKYTLRNLREARNLEKSLEKQSRESYQRVIKKYGQVLF